MKKKTVSDYDGKEQATNYTYCLKCESEHPTVWPFWEDGDHEKADIVSEAIEFLAAEGMTEAEAIEHINNATKD